MNSVRGYLERCRVYKVVGTICKPLSYHFNYAIDKNILYILYFLLKTKLKQKIFRKVQGDWGKVGNFKYKVEILSTLYFARSTNYQLPTTNHQLLPTNN